MLNDHNQHEMISSAWACACACAQYFCSKSKWNKKKRKEAGSKVYYCDIKNYAHVKQSFIRIHSVVFENIYTQRDREGKGARGRETTWLGGTVARCVFTPCADLYLFVAFILYRQVEEDEKIYIQFIRTILFFYILLRETKA